MKVKTTYPAGLWRMTTEEGDSHTAKLTSREVKDYATKRIIPKAFWDFEQKLKDFSRVEKIDTRQVCVQCATILEKGHHLSAIGTCPPCSEKWVKSYPR